MVTAGAVLLAARRWLRKRGRRIEGSDLAGTLFLTLGIAVQLTPVLLFGRRPSETYLYLPTAFASLLVAFFAWRIYDAAGPAGRRVLITLVALFLVLASVATWVRNERVALCARTAARILASMPCPATGALDRTIRVSTLPDSPESTRYGFYGFRGTDTIGDGPHADPALTAALQLSCADPTARAEVVGADRLKTDCQTPREGGSEHGFWVDADGGVFPCGTWAR